MGSREEYTIGLDSISLLKDPSPMASPTPPDSCTAIVLAKGLLRDAHAKTTHALVRGPSRYRILGVIDNTCAGEDAGVALDGRHRGIPVFDSVGTALEELADDPPVHCVIGVATGGGMLPPALRESLLEAARAGLTLVNGLHQRLAADLEIAALAEAHGTTILDIRTPKKTSELSFWTGEVLSLDVPVVPVLGTDCAIGKRTTCWLLRDSFAARGVAAEVVYTGQTGWLQGAEHGFVLDATLNDFVTGELERAILECVDEEAPDLILVEGQSALRNPSGPCGAELIVSTGATGVVLQHAPARVRFIDVEALSIPLPDPREEIEIIRLLGAEVFALTLNSEGLDEDAAETERRRLESEVGFPVALPLEQGTDRVAEVLCRRLGLGRAAK